jgi:hypothetical protein
VVLCTDVDADGATALAARLRAELQRPFDVTAMSLAIDASIGIAVGPLQATDGEELLQLADLAMYSAKARARRRPLRRDAGRPRTAPPRDGGAAARGPGARRAGAALPAQLALQTDTVTGRRGAGALAPPRARGCCSPTTFIDVAESFGLMSA